MRLAALPEGLGSLTALHSLTIRDCNRLAALPEGMINLTALQSLSMHDCDLLNALPEGFFNLTALRKLHISIWKLESLPEGHWQPQSSSESGPILHPLDGPP